MKYIKKTSSDLFNIELYVVDEVTHKSDGYAQKKQAKGAVNPQNWRTKADNLQLLVESNKTC